MRFVVALLLASLLCPLTGAAQALVDRIPSDAMLYVGWQGADTANPDYAASHLKAIVDASKLREFVSTSLPRLVDHLIAITPDPDAKLFLPLLTDMSGELWHHPSAIYFGGVNMQAGAPMPQLAVLCDAGDDAPNIVRRLNDILAREGAPGAVECRQFDNVVVLATFGFPVKPAAPLGADDDFKSALALLDPHPVIVGYANFTAMWKQVDSFVKQFAPPEDQGRWPQLRDGLGLPGLHHMAMTAGFSGPNWSEQAFIDAPAPRQGLIAMLDAPPLDENLLRRIPATSTDAAAASLDLAAALEGIITAVQQVNPDAAPQVQQSLDQVNQMLGLNLQKDFLGAFGPQWAVYPDPTAGGATILNRPRNPDGLEASLTHLEQLANSIVAAQIPDKNITLEIRQEVIDGTRVHYVATPLVSPAWAIKDGTFYLSAFPQLTMASLSRAADAPSILDNPDWQRLRKSLGGPDKISQFQFLDLPRTLPQGYQSTLMLGRLFLGAGDLLGAQSPAMVVPPLDKIMAQTEPGGSIGWTDDAGMHVHTIMPFPGADVMAAAGTVSSMQVAEASMMVSILLPSLNKARATANHVKSASNLRQIGQGCLLYQKDNHGKYPADLGSLFKDEDLTADVFISPDADNAKSPPPGMNPDQAAAWINQNSDYIYYGAGLTEAADPDIVVATENPDVSPDGCNVLFADGHVEFLPPGAYQQAMANSNRLRNPQPHNP